MGVRRSVKTYVAAVVAGVLLCTVTALAGYAAGATRGPGPWTWGAVPDWVEAVATALAALGAGVAVYYARRAYVLERERDLKQERDRRDDRREREGLRRQDERERLDREQRMQADQVAAWMQKGTSPIDGQPETLAVRVRNNSKLPIRSLGIFVEGNGRTIGIETVSVLPPERDYIATLTGAPIPAEAGDLEDLECSIMFVDAAAQVWVRTRLGILEHRDSIT